MENRFPVGRTGFRLFMNEIWLQSGLRYREYFKFRFHLHLLLRMHENQSGEPPIFLYACLGKRR